MINVFINQIHQLSLIISIIVMLALSVLFSFCWPQIQAKVNFLKEYGAVQKIHEGEVSRLGGLITYLGLMTYWLLCCHDGISMPFIEAILLSSVPFIGDQR
jgi:UDP-N-acetylmuramyl pentapeptide phosphotransferase/UDP-N-acetylglucosamine-1-phosphate transferase